MSIFIFPGLLEKTRTGTHGLSMSTELQRFPAPHPHPILPLRRSVTLPGDWLSFLSAAPSTRDGLSLSCQLMMACLYLELLLGDRQGGDQNLVT